MNIWHKLSQLSGVSLIALAGFSGCGGQSENDGMGGSGGSGAATGGRIDGGGATSQSGGSEGGGLDYCMSLMQRRQETLHEAKRCNFALNIEQCTVTVSNGLCGCTTYANPSNQDAILGLKELSDRYAVGRCPIPLCLECRELSHGYCSEAGFCEDVFDAPLTCTLNGVIYSNGARDIRDPTSCNTCECFNGRLTCTDVSCPKACPEGTAPGHGCSECSAKDSCLAHDFRCFPACEQDFCADGGVCQQGACVPLCG